MFGSGNFGINHFHDFGKNLELLPFYSGSFKIFENALWQFIPNFPPKHVISKTNFHVFVLTDSTLQIPL